MRAARSPAAGLLALIAIPLTGCGGGGETVPIKPTTPPELVYVRANRDRPHDDVEIMTSTQAGLSPKRIGRRAGREIQVRLHPDGKRLVFARERSRDDPTSREVFVSSWDNSFGEIRLTGNRGIDDSPCWSSDGEQILFSSDRGGARALWRMSSAGDDVTLLTSGPGEDRDPDWRGDLIVFTRIEGSGAAQRARLYAIDSRGAGLRRITDGGTGAASDPAPGDYEAAIAPDGKSVLFSRVLSPRRRSLWRVDLGSLVAAPITDGTGEDRWPRWSPHGDRLFAAISRPLVGRPGLRLHQLLPDGSGQILLVPDKRFDYPGIDVLPALGKYAPPSAQQPADLDKADFQIPFGRLSLGAPSALRKKDGDRLGVATTIFDGRDIAAIWLEVPLPAARPEDIAEIEIEAVAALSRTSNDSYLRLAVHNPVATRFDTIVETAPPDTSLRTLTYRTASLAHVDRDRRIRIEVIGDLVEGKRAELFVDYVSVRIRTHGTGASRSH